MTSERNIAFKVTLFYPFDWHCNCIKNVTTSSFTRYKSKTLNRNIAFLDDKLWIHCFQSNIILSIWLVLLIEECHYDHFTNSNSKPMNITSSIRLMLLMNRGMLLHSLALQTQHTKARHWKAIVPFVVICYWYIAFKVTLLYRLDLHYLLIEECYMYVHFINSRYPSWKLNRKSTFSGDILMIHRFQMSYFGLKKGQVSLFSKENWFSLKRNKPKFIDSKNFHFHFKLHCSVARHLFSKPTLTCPLLRPNEDIYIGIYVLQRLFNVWHIKWKSVNATSCLTVCSETKKTRKKVFWYFWSWNTAVCLCKPSFPTTTV